MSQHHHLTTRPTNQAYSCLQNDTPKHLFPHLNTPIQHQNNSNFGLEVTDPGGTGFTVAVIGPLLRYVLPPTDRLLVENGNLADDAGELTIPADALASLPGVRFSWLDDGNRLMDAVPESAWPAVVAAAEAHRLAS